MDKVRKEVRRMKRALRKSDSPGDVFQKMVGWRGVDAEMRGGRRKTRPVRRAGRGAGAGGVTLSRTRRTSAPVAIGGGFTSSASTKVERIDQRFEVQADEVRLILPVNPSMWYDSRMAALSKVYQKYRIREVKIEWVPSCSASTSGLVSLGAMPWGTSVQLSALGKELMTTPGGASGKVWDSVVSVPDLTPYKNNWYSIKASAMETSIPFQLFAHTTVATADLGYVIVSAEFEFWGTTAGTSTFFSPEGYGSGLTLTNNVSTQSAYYNYNVGTLFVVADEVDLGDVTVEPGDFLIVTATQSGTNITVQCLRSGTLVEETITGTIPVYKFAWSRTGN